MAEESSAAPAASFLEPDVSLCTLIYDRCLAQPDRTALVVDGYELTYAQLALECADVASWLRSMGAQPGERVLVIGENSAALVTASLGAMWAGCVELVLNASLTTREIEVIARDARPVAVLSADELVSRLPPQVRSLPVRSFRLTGADPAGSVAEAPVTRAGQALASLQYTSGTTGTPKGAALSHGNLVAYLRAVIQAWEFTAQDVLFHSLPLSHGHGRNGVYTALLAGATATVHAKTDVEDTMAALARDGATVYYAVPAIWQRVLRNPAFDAAAFRHLRLFTSGSAPLSPALSDALADRLGSRPLERYGCTETGIITTNPLHGQRIAGTVGIDMPGAETAVVDREGRFVGAGVEGEVVARGPSVMRGYWERPSEEFFLPGGWFRTGDLGRRESSGNAHLVITGRTKELIITGGLNVYPREVELVAESLTGVAQAAAVGIPSREWGEMVALAVVVEGRSIDVDALRRSLRSQLSAYKVPKLVKVVSSLPRNSTGKIVRAELAAGWDDL